MRAIVRYLTATVLGLFICVSVFAQEAPPPISLTLKRAIELALQNSKDIQVARIQASIADRAAMWSSSSAPAVTFSRRSRMARRSISSFPRTATIRKGWQARVARYQIP